MTKRNTRKYSGSVLRENGEDYTRDAHGRKILTNKAKTEQDLRNMGDVTQLLERYPLANDLFNKMVQARAEMIKRASQGQTISNPMYLWEPTYRDEYGIAHPQAVRIVPHSEVGDGMGYTSIRDMLDAFYYNLGYDEEGNKMHDFEKEDFYNLASQRLLDLAAETALNEKGEEVPVHPELVEYIHKQGYQPHAGGRNPNILQQSQEWQEPTFAAGALGLVAPRETPMKFDPEMQTMLKLGNGEKEWEAAAGDIAELGASVLAKPYKIARYALGKGEQAAFKLAPKMMGKMFNWSPKLSKVLRTPATALDKLEDVSVKHPTLSAMGTGALSNAGIYALGKEYNEQVDPENYFESSPYNNKDLAVAAALGAGVPLAGGVAAKFGHFGPFRDLAEEIERNTLSKNDRIRHAFATALALKDPQTAKVIPSAIPNNWIADLHTVNRNGTPELTSSWNSWLNQGMIDLYKKYPELRYGYKSVPVSNVEQFANDEGLQTAQKMGFGDAKSGIRKAVDEKTGKVLKQSYTVEGGVKTPVTSEQTNKYRKVTPYSVADWRKGLSGSQKATLGKDRYANLQLELAGNHPGSNAALDLITASPFDKGKVKVVHPDRYGEMMASLNNSPDVQNYLREKMIAVNDNGVPLRTSIQRDLKLAKKDRAKRQAVFNKLGSDENASPLVDLEKSIKIEPVPMAIGGVLRGFGRTAGRNLPQFGNKNEYEEKE